MLDVAGIALRQRLVVGEVLGYPLGELVVEQLAEVRLYLAARQIRLGLVVDLVDDHAADRQLRLDQLAVEVDGLLDWLALRPADDDEGGGRVGEQLGDPLGALAEPLDHPAEGLKEL